MIIGSYATLKGLTDVSEIENFKEECKKFYNEFYKKDLIAARQVYPKDESGKNRLSHAYAVCIGNTDLPCIKVDRQLRFKYPSICGFISFFYNACSIPTDIRLLFNMQEYFNGSASIPLHYDGEIMDFERDGQRLIIKEAMRPEFVGVFTLCNEAQVGTILAPNFEGESPSSTEVTCEPGEMLLFNNKDYMHGVREIPENKEFDNKKLVRMTVGLRPLEYPVSYKNDSMVTSQDIGPDQAKEILRNFYKNVWPSKRDELLKSGAF